MLRNPCKQEDTRNTLKASRALFHRPLARVPLRAHATTKLADGKVRTEASHFVRVLPSTGLPSTGLERVWESPG